MKTRNLLATLLILIAATTTHSQAQSTTVAFVEVNVIPMDRERVLERQTVVVKDGRIAEIGPVGKVKVPEGAVRVDGRGKYLMPGIAEMHGHLPNPNTPPAMQKAFMTLFVANGVTTVRGMLGAPNQLALRESIAKGEQLGPRLFLAGPPLGGNAVKDPETAARLVREYKQAGYDLLKVHEGLSPESYAAIVKTANEVGIRFGGHIPDSVGLDGALAAKQSSIDHIDGYVEALEADDSPIKNADPQTRGANLHLYLDENKIPGLVSRTKAAGAWVVPTQALWRTFMGSETVESLKQRPELRYVPAGMVNQWSQQRSQQIQGTGPDDRPVLDRFLSLRDKILKALADGNAGVLLGSDAPQLFSVPGFSLQREMEAMSTAGLTPYQILVSATKAPAIYFNREAEFGTVEAGKRADLILLEKNPLADIRNMSSRAGVMAAGRWLSQAELQKMLDAVAAEMSAMK